MAKAQAARTHCPKGHPYDEDNTLVSGGRRRCRRCYGLWVGPRRTLAEEVWQRIAKRPSGCWEWTGCILPTGYGQLGRCALAHRIVYELLMEPIPDGLTLDHLCRNRRCVKPSHLEPVTITENVMRGTGVGPANAAKTHCPKGHEYTPENTYRIPSTGHRQCRACIAARSAPKGVR